MIDIVSYRYPSLKSVRDLLYKHGYGSVDGKRVPLASNADIEKMLGKLFTIPSVSLAECQVVVPGVLCSLRSPEVN